jgi:L-galactose dehydrogenase
MEQVILGRTGLSVGVVGLGCGGKSRLGQSSGASFDDSVRVVQAAIDRGITLIDTAQLYETEEIVGAAIAGRRDGLVLSTKVRVTKVGADPEATDPADMIDPAELRRRVEESLTKLGTDRVEILHLHGITDGQYDYCVETLVPALHDLRQAGKIRFIGLTERFSAETTHVTLARAMTDDHWDVALVGLNFVNQTALEAVLPRAAERRVGTLAMFAVRGALATPERLAKLIRELVATGEIDPARLDPGFGLDFLLAPGVAASLTDAAYRWCRHAPGIDAVLTGTGSIAHLDENIASITAGPLPAEATARLAEIFGAVRSTAPN